MLRKQIILLFLLFPACAPTPLASPLKGGEPTTVLPSPPVVGETSLSPLGETGEGSAPEATQAVSEMDLEPAFTQETIYTYMGVKINAELITDGSLDPVIKEVTVPDATYAEFIARTIFKVWWKKGVEPHTGVATEADFTAFMALWATAQTSGLAENWQKVQVNNIYANDLNDGNGYVQKPYSIWPMFTGVAPEGVRGIESMSIALVDNDKVTNRSIVNENGMAYGTNIDDRDLVVYSGKDKWGVTTNKKETAIIQIMNIVQWLYKNPGNQSGVGFSWDTQLYKILSGLTIR